MKKTILILLTTLALFSFGSCNLDNNGILWTGVNRYPSDDKDRNFIGYSEKTQKLYYTTVNGLSEFDPTNVSSNSEKVLSPDPIFINNAPDISWLSKDGSKIIYVDDYVAEKPEQDYYILNLEEEEPSPEKINKPEELLAGFGLISIFKNNSEQYVIAKNNDTGKAYIYNVSLTTDNALVFSEKNSIEKYVGSLDGLIWSKSDSGTELKFSYLAADVTFKDADDKTVSFRFNDDNDKENDGNQIKSVAVSGGNMVVLRYTDSDTIIVYKGAAGGNAITLKQQSEIIPDDLPGIVHSFYDENNLYFLKSNSSRSSLLYKVTFDNADDGIVSASYSTDVSGLEAEAFFKAGENIYILTKDKGVFRLDINENGGVTVSPVPDLRRR